MKEKQWGEVGSGQVVEGRIRRNRGPWGKRGQGGIAVNGWSTAPRDLTAPGPAQPEVTSPTRPALQRSRQLPGP